MATVVTLGGYDISSEVELCDIMLGFDDPLMHVASIGICSLILHNNARQFSPNNSASPYYDALLPYRLVTVARDGRTLFRGYVQGIRPDAGQFGEQRCVVECVDLLGLLQDHLISLPLQEGQRAGYVLKLITSAALRGQRAAGTITLSGAPANNDTVTIGDVTYTFKTTLTSPAVPYEVKIGGSAGAAAASLAAAINGAGEEWGTAIYAAGTEKHRDVSALYDAAEGAAGGTTTIEPVSNTFEVFIGRNGAYILQEAQSFQASTGTLLQIEVHMGPTKVGDPGTVIWEVREDFGGIPGDILQSGSFTPALNSWNTIAVTGGVTLYAGTQYWLVLRLATIPSNTAYWAWKCGDDIYSGGVLAWSINGAWERKSIYDQTARITTGAIGDATISLTAVARGAWGNTIALAKSGVNITVSAATLLGGVDQPAGLIAFDDGRMVIDIAADTWLDSETNALTAITEVVDSERGYFWGARDGALVFRDQHFPFRQSNAAANMTLDDDHTFQDTSLTAGDVANRAVVNYTPRSTTVEGVIARANAVLAVPGRWGESVGSANYQRWNPSDKITQMSGSRTFTLPFVDVSTGRVAGAKSISLPLEPGVDYTVFDFEDGSGWDYTYSGHLKLSVAVTGSGLEIHATNTALGTLHIIGLQARGVLNIAYDQMSMVIDDDVSQDEYGRRVLSVDLPLQMTDGAALAEQYARYLLSVYSQPRTRTGWAGFGGTEAVGGVSVYDIDIGDVIELSETQTALSGTRHWVRGIQTTLMAGAAPETTFTLQPLGNQGYGVLDDPTYGLLDQVRLAL